MRLQISKIGSNPAPITSLVVVIVVKGEGDNKATIFIKEGEYKVEYKQ
jgi:hypothetical protein